MTEWPRAELCSTLPMTKAWAWACLLFQACNFAFCVARITRAPCDKGPRESERFLRGCARGGWSAVSRKFSAGIDPGKEGSAAHGRPMSSGAAQNRQNKRGVWRGSARLGRVVSGGLPRASCLGGLPIAAGGAPGTGRKASGGPKKEPERQGLWPNSDSVERCGVQRSREGSVAWGQAGAGPAENQGPR